MNTGAIEDKGRFAVVGSVHHGVSLWRTSDNERLYDWNHKAKQDTTLISADFSPDGNWAVTTDTHTIALWNLADGTAPRYWQAPGEILSIKLSPDASHALLGLSDHTAVLFDIQNGGVKRTLNHNGRVRSVGLSSDGMLAITGSEDYTAVVWDLKTGEALQRKRHKDDVQLVAISADGSKAFSASKYDEAVICQNLKLGLRFTCARFSEDGKLLLTGRPDQIISLWEVEKVSLLAQWRAQKKKAWKPTGASIIDVAFAIANNNYYALTSNGFLLNLERIP